MELLRPQAPGTRDAVRLESQETETVPDHSSTVFEHFLAVGFLWWCLEASDLLLVVSLGKKNGGGQVWGVRLKTAEVPASLWAFGALDAPLSGLMAAFLERPTKVSSRTNCARDCLHCWTLCDRGHASNEILSCVLPPQGGVGPGRVALAEEPVLCVSRASCR